MQYRYRLHLLVYMYEKTIFYKLSCITRDGTQWRRKSPKDHTENLKNIPLSKKTHQQQLTTGYCLQYECVGSRSNDSAVVLGIYQLQLQSAVLKTHFAWVNTHTLLPLFRRDAITCAGRWLVYTFKSFSVKEGLQHCLVNTEFERETEVKNVFRK